MLAQEKRTVNLARLDIIADVLGAASIDLATTTIQKLASKHVPRRFSRFTDTENAVPRISKTVPRSSLARLRERMVRAISMISSRGMDLECLMFFSFLRSRGGSLRALMTREEAEGTTETAA